MKEDTKNQPIKVEALNLWEKLTLARIYAQEHGDFSPNAVVKQGSGTFRIISGSKIRSQLAPIFSKFGIDYTINYDDPCTLAPIMRDDTVLRDNNIRIKATMVIRNVNNPEETQTYTAWGQGSDTLDKALSIAQSYAVRSILQNVFLLSTDGYDEPTEDIGVVPLFQLSKPQAQVPTPAPTKTATLTTPEAKTVEKPEEKTEEKKKTIPPIEKPSGKLDGILGQAFEKSKAQIEAAHKDGKMSDADYKFLKQLEAQVVDSKTFATYQTEKKRALL